MTGSELVAHIEEKIEQFRKDPPDTDFQRGYLTALENLIEEIERTRQ